MVTTDATPLENGKPRHSGGGRASSRESGKRRKGGGKRQGRPHADESAGADGADAAAKPLPGAPARPPMKVGVAAAGRRIRGIGDVSESLEVRRRLRRLARQIERRSQDAQHMAFVEGAIGDCLDDAESAGDRERWLMCEAATWGLAWMARTRRAGGSAGGLLERLVREARSAQAGLASGDTRSARFVLALSRLFADIEACRCLESGAAAALAAEIGRLVSEEGTIGLQGSVAMLERMVHWSLARDIALATGSPAWDAATERLLARAAATSLRLLGGQGRLLVGAGRMPPAFSDPLLEVAVAARRKRVRRTAERVQVAGRGADARKPRGKRGHTDGKLLPRDHHDAAAAVAIIRSGWERDAVRVLLDYRTATPHLEVAVGDRLLVEGPWRWSASHGGRPLEPSGPWSLSCWESDKKATYLEIVAPLADGLQIDRQVVLLPAERILLLADAITHRSSADGATPPRPDPQVVPRPDGDLQMRAVLPLAATLEGDETDETREVLVYDTRPRLLCLPLASPEWRAAGRGGLSVGAEGLVLDHHAAGSRCYAPVWLDLDPSRQGRPLTWRQLTVADTRQNLPPHQAVGFRVQVGLEQWLVYRTLDEVRNRTLLGCNVACGFLVGRIEDSGVVDRAIEIH